VDNRYKNLIDEFDSNFRQLLLERNNLKEENVLLQQELLKKQNELMEAHKNIIDLRNEYTLLRTTTGLNNSVDDREFSRRRLVKMMQEIDKCLTLLKG
jgi:hypothetical protein